MPSARAPAASVQAARCHPPLAGRAARQEDELVYEEPPEWPVPVRHDPGEVLLAVGLSAEAEQVYREELKRFPENGWSLRGLAESLWTQGRSDECRGMEERFRAAWVAADFRLTAPRF